MDLPISIPTDLYGWISLVAIIAAGVLFIRNRDIKAIRENAEDLRQILSDKTKEIVSLQGEVRTMQVKIEELEKRNRTLEDLVVVALKQFFFENPKIASDLKGKVMK